MSAASTLNGRFISLPDVDTDAIRVRWDRLDIPDRRRLITAIGPAYAVRECGLPVVEVAMAWHRPWSIETRLEAVRRMARDG